MKILGFIVSLILIASSTFSNASFAGPRRAPGISFDEETQKPIEPIDRQRPEANPNHPDYDDSLLFGDDSEQWAPIDGSCESFLLN